jgi:hypothetical protein
MTHYCNIKGSKTDIIVKEINKASGPGVVGKSE